ncbi:MAG TPA: T9SS type A sorting domain-containing protein, partial [Bacteroidia bacterium]
SNVKDSSRYGMPAWYKGNTYFPVANRAHIAYSDTSDVYFQMLSSNALLDLGHYASTMSTENIYRLSITSLKFPSTYQSKFIDSGFFIGSVLNANIDIDTAGPLPFIDSIRIINRSDANSVISGWGQLSTPLGNFNCLQQKLLKTNRQVVEMYANQKWVLAPQKVVDHFNIFIPLPDSIYHIKYWTNSASYGVPVMQYVYYPKDTVLTAIGWLTGAAHKNSIVRSEANDFEIYPNPFNQNLNIDVATGSTVIVIDASGKTVINTQVLGNAPIETAHLKAGLYWITVRSADGLLIAQKQLFKSE